MNTLLRSLFVWLLLLAVPFQGMAAAAMAACAHGMPSQAIPAAAPVQHQGRDAQLPPCHQSATAGTTDHREAAPAHADGKCGTCAACGIGTAALPARLPELAADAPASVAGPFAASGLPSVHLAQPERPPRPCPRFA